jgi:hypothetical protein
MQSNVRSRPRLGVFAAPEQRWFQCRATAARSALTVPLAPPVSSRSPAHRADLRIGHRRRCRDCAASRRDERAFLRDLPNLARAASTYSYSPDRSRGLIPTLALPNLRQGYRKGGAPAALEFTAGSWRRGTEGSNPSSSSGESRANLTSWMRRRESLRRRPLRRRQFIREASHE